MLSSWTTFDRPDVFVLVSSIYNTLKYYSMCSYSILFQLPLLFLPTLQYKCSALMLFYHFPGVILRVDIGMVVGLNGISRRSQGEICFPVLEWGHIWAPWPLSLNSLVPWPITYISLYPFVVSKSGSLMHMLNFFC